MEPLFEILIHTLKNALLIVAALLPILNPFGGAPIFLAITRGASAETRHFLARRIALNSVVVLIVAMFIGSYVLEYFGISTGTVKIAGGLLVASMGWKMVQAEDPPQDGAVSATADWSRQVAERRAFYPLTFPLTVGPGSIAVALTLAASIYKDKSGFRPLAAPISAVIGVLVLAVVIYLCYRFADRMVKLIGDTGTTVLLRLAAFVLLCIGLEIVVGGLTEIMPTLLPKGR